MGGGEDMNEAASGPGPGSNALPVFRGVTQLALDAKGRLAIPARHRDALASVSGGRCIVTADPSRCLLLYPLGAWEPIQAKLLALPSFNERTRGVQRLLVGHADDVELDGAGRILVPPALRRYAGLDRTVVLVGQGHKFEIWDEAQWSAQTAQTLAFPPDALPAELGGISL
jgi:MraZ protein